VSGIADHSSFSFNTTADGVGAIVEEEEEEEEGMCTIVALDPVESASKPALLC